MLTAGVVSTAVTAFKRPKAKPKRDLSDELFSREPQGWAEFRP